MTKVKSSINKILAKEWLANNSIKYTISADRKINIGSLDLQDTKITALPDNLTVGGYLDLRGTAITALPDNLTVGGSLDLRGTAITALPDNLTVGGYLDLRGTAITAPKKLKRPSSDFSVKLKASIEVKFNLRGYSIADGILSKILSKKGAVSRILIAGKKKQSYLVCDDKGNYAHGETIAKAQEDLIFKVIERSDVEIPSKATGKEWVGIYRAVTGACSAGVKNFVEQTGKSLNDTYTSKEIAKMVQGQYGAEQFAKRLK